MWSRSLVFAVSWLANATLPWSGYAATALHTRDRPFASWPLEGALNFIFAPLARWDAAWYLSIAQHGYTAAGASHHLDPKFAFFPLYPETIGLLGFHTAAGSLFAGYVVSGVAFLLALVVLHRLVGLELGQGAARATVWILAFSPFAYFFAAPYTESLFLLLSVCAFYFARTERWGSACVVAALASATRSTGVLLVVPLGLLYFYGPRANRAPARRLGWRVVLPRYRPQRSAGWLALCPMGVVAYSAYVAEKTGQATGWATVERYWGHVTVFPLEAVRRGATAAWHSLWHLGSDMLPAANIVNFLVLLAALVALVGVFRALPLPYGFYTLAVLVAALSSPIATEPLRSLGRYVTVLFPIFVWLGSVIARRRLTTRFVGASALSLGLLTAGFAVWEPFI